MTEVGKTDDDLDIRLHAAGERWRAATDTVPRVDVTLASRPTRSSHTGSAAVAFAAAIVIAIVVTVSAVLHGESREAGPAGPATSYHDYGIDQRRELIGPQWKVAYVQAGGGRGPVINVSGETLFFTDKTITKSDYCDTMSAPVTIHPDVLVIDAMSEGEIHSCPYFPSESTPIDLSGLLRGRVYWVVQGRQLTLIRGGTAVTFRRG